MAAIHFVRGGGGTRDAGRTEVAEEMPAGGEDDDGSEHEVE